MWSKQSAPWGSSKSKRTEERIACKAVRTTVEVYTLGYVGAANPKAIARRYLITL